MFIKDRAKIILNLPQYNSYNFAEIVTRNIELTPPKERQFVLRMLIKKIHTFIYLPNEYKWVMPLIEKAVKVQKESICIEHSFMYLTIRHGIVTTITDDDWHVDGFSMRVNHIPEQNYIWSDCFPTQMLMMPIVFPNDFDPLKHNIHYYIQDKFTDEEKIIDLDPKTLYCIDPYVIHRRNPLSNGKQRTFIRISFTPIEIRDDLNTRNPYMEYEKYYNEGVKDFRNSLIRYEI